MANYRPICDVWILARPKVKFYGAYPSGFLSRARELLGVHPWTPVLHVCSGRVRDYPLRGFGPFDKTVDLDPSLEPDFVLDVRKDLPQYPGRRPSSPGWPAILADPPYTEEDAKHYAPGDGALPEPTKLLRLCLESVRPGGRVGMLHYAFPRPQKKIESRFHGIDYEAPVRLVACVGVVAGYGNRMRCFSVFEREAPSPDLIPDVRISEIREGVRLIEP